MLGELRLLHGLPLAVATAAQRWLFCVEINQLSRKEASCLLIVSIQRLSWMTYIEALSSQTTV